MEEEIHTLNSRASKYRRERETYKEMVEGLQKNRPPSRGPGGGGSGGGGNADKDKINELQYKIQVLEDELGDAKLEASKANASMNAVQSTHEIQVAIRVLISQRVLPVFWNLLCTTYTTAISDRRDALEDERA